MNVKIKFGSIILATLILGMVLGGLIHSTVMKNRIRQIREFRGRGGFESFIERVIEPDEAQRQQLQEIFNKYSAKFNEIRFRQASEFSAVMDSMRVELDPILTPEQKKKLEEMRLRRPRNGPPGKPGLGPPDRDKR